MYAEDNTKNPNYDKEYQYFDRLHGEKYRDTGQSKSEHNRTLAHNLCSNEKHFAKLLDIIENDRFLAAGRIQAAMGANEREVSPFNCSVSAEISDSIDGIYKPLWDAAKILRLGTGIGYNFSKLRPKGFLVTKLQTEASGPISYMQVYNESAKTIASAGHRRGAQMGILNVDHPDIEAFIDSKMVKGAFEYFNLSVGITDDFMRAVKLDLPWTLGFGHTVTKTIRAKDLWNKILTNAYNSAEPGVVFLTKMNSENNLWYCEEIEATNPCSEQPLPPHGLCTLGSFNLVKYLFRYQNGWAFDYKQFTDDIHNIVEAYDNIFEKAIYAIPEHKEEALSKRRIGLGLTGIANACEMLVGEASYGDFNFLMHLTNICNTLKIEAYTASVELAKTRGPFPKFDPIDYTSGKFIRTLPERLQKAIEFHGIRNSHLISYAPCGTISQIAGNVSSGVEPVFFHEVQRNVIMKSGKEKITISDWAFREHGFKGRTLEECTVEQHLAVGQICQMNCDSAVSKTINAPADLSYEDYAGIYMQAYDRGMKGCTVYIPNKETKELRGAVIEKAEEPVNTSEMNTMSCASGVCER